MELIRIGGEVVELHRFLLIISLIIFFSAMFLWPLGWVFRRPSLAKKTVESVSYKPIFSISRYVSIVMVLCALIYYFFLSRNTNLIGVDNYSVIVEALGFWRGMVYALPSLLIFLLPIQLFLLVMIWIGNHGTKVFKVHLSLVSVSLIIYLGFMLSWNLLIPGYYLSLIF